MNLISRLIYWYFSKKSLPYWGLFLIDCLIIYFSSLLVWGLTNGAVGGFNGLCHLSASIAFYMVFYIIGFRLFHTYTGVIRYSSFVDLQRVAAAIFTGLILSLFISTTFHLTFLKYLSPRDMLLSAIFSIMAMWSVRVSVKYLYDTFYHRKESQRIFVYGVKSGGVSIAKSIRNQDPSIYTLAGFVSDEPDMRNRMLMGVKVYQIDENLVDVMDRHSIKALFVSPAVSESLRKNTQLVNSLIQSGIKIFMVPAEQEWDGKCNISHQSLREVEIEDLLPRDKIEVDMNAISDLLKGKKILITGAAGSIGSEIVRQVASIGNVELVLIDQAETPLHDIRLMMLREFPNITAHTIVADIANKKRMEEIFSAHRPHYVFHAAAYKHVPMMEDNPSESIQNNVEGTRIVADLSVKYRAGKFVMVSTDKAVNPTNVMGCSKRICEIYVQSLDKAIKDGCIEGCTHFVTTRFGNVLGSNGSVIPLFREQIKKGGPITVTHPNIIRYFMLIPEACKLVLEAATMGKGGEIFVFDMGQPVKIVDLARRMILLSGADIEIKFTGLRDGEKLYEEVLDDKETTTRTIHPKIKIAKVREYDYFDLKTRLDALIEASFTASDMDIVRIMKDLVPEYHSQHSKYEILDIDNAL